jgi:hypothetical protein
MRKQFGKRKTSDYKDDYKYTSKGTPKEDETVETGLSMKALASLPHSSYSVQADPYQASLPTSDPYPIINVFNKNVGGAYAGDRNIDGGNVQQYANSTASKFLNMFDFARLKLNMNYRYRPMVDKDYQEAEHSNIYIGSKLVDECRNAIAEATSVLQSTTFTQMAINDYCIETDLPMGSAVRTEGTGTYAGRYFYSDLSDVIYGSMTFYQLFLQNVIATISWHNSFRLKQGTCIKSSWNRETPTLNSIFSLFNKKAFVSQIDGICLSLPGEYVDVDWVRQLNMIASMPSRRSNAMTDPVLECQVKMKMPTVFKMYVKDPATGQPLSNKAIFDASVHLKKTVPCGQGQTLTMDFIDAVDEIMTRLSAENIMAWARTNNSLAGTANLYFNDVKFRFDIIQACITTFKTQFNDVREVLDVISRTGMNTWQKGFRPSVVRDTNAPLFNNNIVNDIFKTCMSGATQLVYDDKTKRYRFYSLWNIYKGIPEYDAYSGGAFLSLSGKEIVTATDTDNTRAYLPVAFYPYVDASDTGANPQMRVTNRVGQSILITAADQAMSEVTELQRFVPLRSQENLELRVPEFRVIINEHEVEGFTDTSEYLEDATASLLQNTLTKIFGVSCLDIQTVEPGEGEGADPIITHEYKFQTDPDMLAVYQVEINDITNESIAYARQTNVFRGTSDPREADKLGFSKFGQK